MEATITGVRSILQREDRIYMFTLTAADVVRLCRVERFGQDHNGVNRKLNPDHAIAISEAMLDHSLLWLEPIFGDLSGAAWGFDEVAGELRYIEGESYFSIDNGQHRWHALSLLNAVEREHLAFPMIATMGIPYQRRLAIFRMQRHQRPLDSRLDLAQRNVLGEWKSPLDKEAYDLLLLLNSDTTSPLKGLILLEEQEKRPHEGRHRPVGINGKGLHSTIRSAIGTSSPLNDLSPEQRRRVILSIIQLASQVWSKQWKSDKHALTTARGINALLGLMVSSANFRGIIADDFTHESLRKGLEFASTFNWAASELRNDSVRSIIDRINQSIGRNKRTKKAAA